MWSIEQFSLNINEYASDYSQLLMQNSLKYRFG